MSSVTSRELALLDSCSKTLARAERIDQLTDLRSRAEAIRVWAKSAHQSLEVQNRAAALRLAAERKAGKLLLQMHLRGGDRKSNGHDDRLILEDLGITQSQSKRWQKQAAISDDEFEQYVSGSTLIGKEITAAGLLRLTADSKQKSGTNGKSGPQKAVTLRRKSFSSSELHFEADKDLLYDLQEVSNHINLLGQVLTPYASDETQGLSKAEKRIVISLLDEIESLFKKVFGR